MRRHARVIAGCIGVFAVGIVVGLVYGPGGSSGEPRSTTVVTVGTTLTVKVPPSSSP
jgi:hypothetical protein